MDDLRLIIDEETLWTRYDAEPIRERLLGLLAQARPGQSVVIDAHRLQGFDHSFAAELFAQTAGELPSRFPGVFVVVDGLAELPLGNLAATLRDCNRVMLARRADGGLALVGDHHPLDQQTLDAVRSSEALGTAAGLSDLLGISVNAVNERLSKLVRLGLVRRVEGVSSAGRKQFTYHSAS